MLGSDTPLEGIAPLSIVTIVLCCGVYIYTMLQEQAASDKKRCALAPVTLLRPPAAAISLAGVVSTVAAGTAAVAATALPLSPVAGGGIFFAWRGKHQAADARHDSPLLHAAPADPGRPVSE